MKLSTKKILAYLDKHIESGQNIPQEQLDYVLTLRQIVKEKTHRFIVCYDKNGKPLYEGDTVCFYGDRVVINSRKITYNKHCHNFVALSKHDNEQWTLDPLRMTLVRRASKRAGYALKRKGNGRAT